MKSYSKFSKSVYSHKDSGFDVKHIIQLGNWNKDPNLSSKKPYFTYDIVDRLSKRSNKGLVLLYDDHILFSRNVKIENVKIQSLNAFFILKSDQFQKFLENIEEAIKWLKDQSFSNLFTTNPDGIITGISSSKIFNVVKTGNMWLMLQPAVITDNLNFTYQGIQLKSTSGVLANLTCDEFLSFALNIRNLINNFYSASLQLYIACMLTLSIEGETENGNISDK
jgi:hypothetical protein